MPFVASTHGPFVENGDQLPIGPFEHVNHHARPRGFDSALDLLDDFWIVSADLSGSKYVVGDGTPVVVEKIEDATCGIDEHEFVFSPVSIGEDGFVYDAHLLGEQSFTRLDSTPGKLDDVKLWSYSELR